MKTLRKVLVVDDDPVVGKSFDRVLSGKGYAVITASNATDALDRLAREDYVVVFTDIKMPGMDGLEMAGRVKAKRPWLPVVIVTGYGNEANEAAAKGIGVAGFLHKPLSPEMIESSAIAALVAPIPAVAPIQAVDTLAPAIRRSARVARNLGLFFAAPFIGLAYAIALPLVGLGMLAWHGYRAMAKKDRPK